MVQSRIAVLLATYNGEKFLQAQLESLARQTLPNVDVWVSDDGSSDGTLAILAEWRERWPLGKFTLLTGPNKGFVENFRSLLSNGSIDTEFYAFCDQDDLWDPDKLEKALARLDSNPQRPQVYCCRTRIIDPDGQVVGQSVLFKKPTSFRNAIVQSIAGGNTMVLNRAARILLAESCRRTNFVTHDWWTYMIVTGSGGELHYSADPSVSYRQHGSNLIGENKSLRARLDRLRWFMAGRFKSWGATNVGSLDLCVDLLAPDSIATLRAFKLARTAGVWGRVFHLARSGAYRQGHVDNIGLYLACLFKKL